MFSDRLASLVSHIYQYFWEYSIMLTFIIYFTEPRANFSRQTLKRNYTDKTISMEWFRFTNRMIHGYWRDSQALRTLGLIRTKDTSVTSTSVATLVVCFALFRYTYFPIPYLSHHILCSVLVYFVPSYSALYWSVLLFPAVLCPATLCSVIFIIPNPYLSRPILCSHSYSFSCFV